MCEPKRSAAPAVLAVAAAVAAAPALAVVAAVAGSVLAAVSVAEVAAAVCLAAVVVRALRPRRPAAVARAPARAALTRGQAAIGNTIVVTPDMFVEDVTKEEACTSGSA